MVDGIPGCLSLLEATPEMTYTLVTPPFSLRFKEMRIDDLRAYHDWFLRMVPTRASELSETVANSPGCESFHGDFSPDSLDALGDWLARQVQTRPRTEAELQA
jgi:hypothetical protein